MLSLESTDWGAEGSSVHENSVSEAANFTHAHTRVNPGQNEQLLPGSPRKVRTPENILAHSSAGLSTRDAIQTSLCGKAPSISLISTK